jgi:hypothetical protein
MLHMCSICFNGGDGGRGTGAPGLRPTRHGASAGPGNAPREPVLGRGGSLLSLLPLGDWWKITVAIDRLLAHATAKQEERKCSSDDHPAEDGAKPSIAKPVVSHHDPPMFRTHRANAYVGSRFLRSCVRRSHQPKPKAQQRSHGCGWPGRGWRGGGTRAGRAARGVALTGLRLAGCLPHVAGFVTFRRISRSQRADIAFYPRSRSAR